MHTESIEYEADGARRVGYLAVDRAPGGRRPGVLIAHEANGVSEVVKERARKLAELGYVAFAMDYVGDGVVLEGFEKTAALLAKYREAPERIRAIGRASLDVLRAQPECDADKIAAIGYCYGGAAVLELARDGADLACIVGFHAQLSTKDPEDAHRIKGKVLACIGADDPWVPADQRLAFEQEMRAAKVDWRLHVYGGAVHGFANPNADRLNNPAVAYHRPSHERSWRAMIDLFDETFGRPI
ncbi:dienelactone hydrolase family protein [Pendulispora rubella]|uniref:Dienelactone hydrolase family protein n=1 Tax=Pendulispora rubella TaxID=2741070 RepID=A0ABZ2KP18_9BACT